MLALRSELRAEIDPLRDQIDAWTRPEHDGRFEFLVAPIRARDDRLQAIERWLARIGRDWEVLALSDGEASEAMHRSVLIARLVRSVEAALPEAPQSAPHPPSEVAILLGVALHPRGYDLAQADAAADLDAVAEIWRSETAARRSRGKRGRRACAVRIVARTLQLTSRRVETFLSEARARLADESAELTAENVAAALRLVRGESER